jgi:hypothetical protein
LATKAIVLLAIMIMSFAISPQLTEGQIAPISSSENSNLKTVLDQRYLALLSLRLNTTQICSSVESYNGKLPNSQGNVPQATTLEIGKNEASRLFSSLS